MSWNLPEDAPKTTGEAFAYLDKIRSGTTVDDLKILALAEVIGKVLYDELAERVDQPEIKELFRHNGREELAHAYRVGKAIEKLTGEAFPIPTLEEHPFYTPIDPMPLTKEALQGLAAAERAGQDMYADIASSFSDPEVLALLRQNGKEEFEHGEHVDRIIELMDN